MTLLTQTRASADFGAIARSFSPDAFSPLMLSDQLLTLAQYADRAGLRPFADDLLNLALLACDHRPSGRQIPQRRTRAKVRLAA